MRRSGRIVAFRLASWDTPFWVNPNRAARRFNHADSGPVQYFSLDPLTPWAEYLREKDARSLEQLLEMRVRLWAARVSTKDVFELTYDNAAELGLKAADLISDDYGPCQELGDRCGKDPTMPKALIVPSAALPGTRNLVIFGPRVGIPYAEPIDEIDVPVSVAAEDARALHTLVELVRYRGDSHPEYEAWREGRIYELGEPRTPLLDV